MGVLHRYAVLLCGCVSAGQGKCWEAVICVVLATQRQSDSRADNKCSQWRKDTCYASRLED
jgi:plasmid replication initiation protein